MPEQDQEQENHGQSVAAWTAVTILLLAALVMSFAVVFASKVWFGVGVVVAVVGVVVGKVLSNAGYGAAPRHPSRQQPGGQRHQLSRRSAVRRNRWRHRGVEVPHRPPGQALVCLGVASQGAP